MWSTRQGINDCIIDPFPISNRKIITQHFSDPLLLIGSNGLLISEEFKALTVNFNKKMTTNKTGIAFLNCHNNNHHFLVVYGQNLVFDTKGLIEESYRSTFLLQLIEFVELRYTIFHCHVHLFEGNYVKKQLLGILAFVQYFDYGWCVWWYGVNVVVTRRVPRWLMCRSKFESNNLDWVWGVTYGIKKYLK